MFLRQRCDDFVQGVAEIVKCCVPYGETLAILFKIVPSDHQLYSKLTLKYFEHRARFKQFYEEEPQENTVNRISLLFKASKRTDRKMSIKRTSSFVEVPIIDFSVKLEELEDLPGPGETHLQCTWLPRVVQYVCDIFREQSPVLCGRILSKLMDYQRAVFTRN